MNGGEDFFDTNVVLYLLSADAAKADRAEELLAIGGTISVQVLNEFVAVASRKLRMPWIEIREVLAQILSLIHISRRAARAIDGQGRQRAPTAAGRTARRGATLFQPHRRRVEACLLYTSRCV